LNLHKKTIYFAPLKFTSLVLSQSLFQRKEWVRSFIERYGDIRKMLERAYLEKKGNYFWGKIDNKKEGKVK
jgi:hypothetical protein